MKNRASGILLHISSLPGDFGIGTFGKEAYEFVDFLKRAKQTYWQILPLTTTSYGDSPYQSFSAIAGNTHFIDFVALEEDLLLEKQDYEEIKFFVDENKVDYNTIYHHRRPVLKKAVENFLKHQDNRLLLKAFEKENIWLADFSLFMAVKEFFDNKQLEDWPDKHLLARDENTIKKYQKKLSNEINYHKVCQYFFFKQWQKLKTYANHQGIKIIGDMPIYVSRDSVEMWANKNLFKLDKNGNLSYVSGVPADDFSPEGQFWGNPIYDWQKHKKDNYAWWVERIKKNFEIYDVVRLDHFRGFSEFWQIKANSKTALKGRWVKGPGIKLFHTIKKELGDLEIIAEDLGIIDEHTEKLLKDTAYPGMKVLQFAFDGNINNTYLLDSHTENSVAYLGTHDNDTTQNWFLSLDKAKQDEISDYFDKKTNESISQAMVRVLFESDANTIIISMQDLIEKPSAVRMNTPGTSQGNWQWRMSKNDLTSAIEENLRNLSIINKRN